MLLSRVARYFRVRPSDLLKGDLDAYHMDMLIGAAALEKVVEQRQVIGKDDMAAGIADAVMIGTSLGG